MGVTKFGWLKMVPKENSGEDLQWRGHSLWRRNLMGKCDHVLGGSRKSVSMLDYEE